MPPLGPIKRKDLIHYLREVGFEGPYVGGRHEFMVKGTLKLFIPNPHHGDISPALLARLLRQAEIAEDEWARL
jgi:predicted RNA binding protein YcfA (HicA-like mRNA interferase family)